LPVSGDCASSTSANASAARAVRIEWETGGGECGGTARRVEQEKAPASSRRRCSGRRRSLPALRHVDANSRIQRFNRRASASVIFLYPLVLLHEQKLPHDTGHARALQSHEPRDVGRCVRNGLRWTMSAVASQQSNRSSLALVARRDGSGSGLIIPNSSIASSGASTIPMNAPGVPLMGR
jgi:hypothetical protein